MSHSDIPDPKRRYVSVVGYWRNDQPDGINISIGDTPGDDPETVDYINKIMEAIDQIVASVSWPKHDVVEWLTHFGRGDIERTQENQIYCLAVITYAEESGFIESDEWNGMTYMIETTGKNKKELAVVRRDKAIERHHYRRRKPLP